MVKEIIRWQCEVCKEEYIDKNNAIDCEAKGMPCLHPVGMIFSMARGMFDGMVFAIIKQHPNAWKHNHSYSTWACRDTRVGDNCGGEQYCGLKSRDKIYPPDKSLAAYQRMVKALQDAGISPSDYEAVNVNEKKEKKESKPICEQCGYTNTPDNFNASISPYHDLQCPECGTTNIAWDNGSYKHNNLTLDEE